MHVTDLNINATFNMHVTDVNMMFRSVNMHVTDVNIDVQKRTMLWRARASANGCFD
jgi:hypothetical protein